MKLARRSVLAGVAAGMAPAQPWPAAAEGTPKRGGILRAYHPDSPASMSLLEETTISVVAPMMSVFGNLVVYDPHIPQNSIKSVIPELATDWSWSDGGNHLDFTLRRGVAWHDGKPFSSADVVHTWNLIQGKLDDKLRINPRASWYVNVEAVVANGDDKVSFRLKRPQPALILLLAAAGAPI
jgi:peptide/nickel transport system substrate-binding protein